MEIIYYSRNILSKEITNITKANIDKTQEEIDELIKKYNEEATQYTNHQIKDDETLELARFAIKWKSEKTLENIYSTLDDIYDEINSAKYEISDYLEEKKKQQVNSTK